MARASSLRAFLSLIGSLAPALQLLDQRVAPLGFGPGPLDQGIDPGLHRRGSAS